MLEGALRLDAPWVVGVTVRRICCGLKRQFMLEGALRLDLRSF